MVMDLQQRAAEYGPWRNNAETEGGHGRLESSTCRVDYKWGDTGQTEPEDRSAMAPAAA